MIKRKEVKVFIVSLYCDECGSEMLPNGQCLMSSPPQYPHICEGCGNKENISGLKYPYKRYE